MFPRDVAINLPLTKILDNTFMSDYRHIYNILTLSIECSEHPEYMKGLWSNEIYKMIRRWNPRLEGEYTEEMMVDDVIRHCSTTTYDHSSFWYIAPQDCSPNEAIRLTTIALFECLNYYFWYDAPGRLIIDADKVKNILGYKLHIYWKKYNLKEYSFEQIREVLAEGMRGRLCDWLGENRAIAFNEWAFLKKNHFPFANPKQKENSPNSLLSFFAPTCKMNELDYTPLYEHLASFNSGWESTKEEAPRRLLFLEMDSHLWRIVTDASSCVWGG